MAVTWAGDVQREETPRSKYVRDLGVQGAQDRAAMAREKEVSRRMMASMYHEALIQKDREDYNAALKMYQDLGNLPSQQQEIFKQTDGFKQMQKIWKRVQLPVFDESTGEVVMPVSKADATAKLKEMEARVNEDIRSGRKPNEQDLGTIIGVLNNAKENATTKQQEDYLDQLLNKYIGRLGQKAGVAAQDDQDPLGLMSKQQEQ